jgi:predicted GNAT superfamily acetyltransferase
MQVVDISEACLEEALALNEASVPAVNSLDFDQLRWFAERAPYFRCVQLGGRLAGFLIGLGPGLDYASPNYQWFCRKHRMFGYVDRVAVAQDLRRQGIGSMLYDDFADTIQGRAPVMTCEVNIRPPNESSMAYHLRHGFVCVATQETENGAKEVALMEKTL